VQGNLRKPGETYQRPNKRFIYLCNNGAEEVVGKKLCLKNSKICINFPACISSDRAKNIEIKVGETKTIEGFWYKCEKFANHSVIYTEGKE
jgi:hypothetical protein